MTNQETLKHIETTEAEEKNKCNNSESRARTYETTCSASPAIRASKRGGRTREEEMRGGGV